MANQGNRGFSYQQGQRPIGQQPTRPQTNPTGVIDTARETANEWMAEAGDQAQQAWDTTRRSVEDFATNLPHNAQDAVDSVGTFIRRNPVPSLLCAVGLGFVLARALNYD